MINSIYFTILKKELKELVRSGKIIIFMAVFLFFGLLSPIAAKFLPQIISSIGDAQKLHITIPEPTWLDAVAQYLKNLTQMCTFIIIIIFMGSVSKEKESGTAFFLLVKPVSRLSFLVAKFSSTIIATILSLAIAFLAASLYTYIFFDEFSFTGFAKLNLVMLLYLVSIIFMTIMFSTIFSSQLLAGLFSFLGWMVISIFTQFGEIGKYSPSMLISEANSVIMNSNILWQPFVGAFALMIISFTISYYTFRKWEA